jgi:hypothetical protein
MDSKDGNGTRVSLFCVVICSHLLIVPSSVFSKQEIVFARTSPKHKLEIGQRYFAIISSMRILTNEHKVKRAQALGHVVGV